MGWMTATAAALGATLFMLLSACAEARLTQAARPVLVEIRTSEGTITVAVDTDRAPATSANFLRYVRGGLYDGGLFHRAVTPDNQPGQNIKIEVIQASINPAMAAKEFPPIPLERTTLTGIKHLDGTVSMARAEPDSATSDFFICIGDQPSLDFGGMRNPDGQGFAAFARVVRGMGIVRKIQHSPARGQSLDPPVTIDSVRIIGE
jgi:peptidyl-prolyl cis-trans isomerase A (cyclophilin A)